MQTKPLIIADRDIPFLEGVLEPYAEVRYLKGSAITANDVRGAEVLALCTPDTADEVEKEVDVVWRIPGVPADLAPVLTIVPMQMLAYYMALEKGCDIDKPRNLAKSVTVE